VFHRTWAFLTGSCLYSRDLYVHGCHGVIAANDDLDVTGFCSYMLWKFLAPRCYCTILSSDTLPGQLSPDDNTMVQSCFSHANLRQAIFLLVVAAMQCDDNAARACLECTHMCYVSCQVLPSRHQAFRCPRGFLGSREK
jgi:hypothetical protein